MKEGREPFLNVDLDLVFSVSEVVDLHLESRHVHIECLHARADVSDLLLEIELFVVELDEVVPLYVLHQPLYALLKGVHCFANTVFLTQVLIPELVQRVVVDTEEALDALLVPIELSQHELSLRDVAVLQLYDILLDGTTSFGKDKVVVASVSREAEAAVELLVDLAAVFDLGLFVLGAEEQLWVVFEVLDFIDH